MAGVLHFTQMQAAGLSFRSPAIQAGIGIRPTLPYGNGMDQPVQDLRELLHMAALLKGAAGRAAFRDCSAIFLGVAQMLERQAVTMAGGGSSTPLPAPPRHPINIMT